MYVYFLELIIILFLAILLKQKYIKKIDFLILSFGVLAIVLGLRGINVGEDTKHYIDIFEKSFLVKWKDVFWGKNFNTVYQRFVWGELKIESGYMLINKVLGIFTANPQSILFVCSLITCALFAKFIYDNSENVVLSTFIFVCESLYMRSFNEIRQLLAISIVIQVYYLLKNKKYKTTILAYFLAFTIHKSSIVFLLIIPLMYVKNYQKFMKYQIMGTVLLYFLLPLIKKIVIFFNPLYEAYFYNNFWSISLGGTLIFWIIEIIMIIHMYVHKINNQDEFVIISLILYYILFSLWGYKITVFERVSLYFRTFVVLLFPKFEKYIKNDSRIIYYFGISVLLILNFISYTKAPSRLYVPYWKN